MNVPEKSGVGSERRTAFKATPAEVRAQANMYSEASKNTTDANLKRAFASVAFALAQLGECIERLDVSPRS